MSEIDDDDVVFIEPTTKDQIEFLAEESQAFDLAAHIMSEYKPGFVIIGSPNIALTDSGVPYPDGIGVIINHEVGITKTALAEILMTLVHNLNGDMDKIQNFLKEALGDSD